MQTHNRANIYQIATDYYPFGLEHQQAQPTETQGQGENQNFGFNGKEFHTHVNWIDYGARFYNPALGRWHNVDAMAETYHTLSPYHFSGNNPVFFIEYNGMSYGGISGAETGLGGKGDKYGLFYRNLENIAKYATNNISVLVENLLEQSGYENSEYPGNKIATDATTGPGAKFYFEEGNTKSYDQAMDNAAWDFKRETFTNSVEENREYASKVYIGKDNKGVFLVYTKPKIGGKYGVTPSRIKGAKYSEAWFHTHGNPNSRGKLGDWFFSYKDLNYSEGNRMSGNQVAIGYLLFPGSKTGYKYIPKGGGTVGDHIGWERIKAKQYYHPVDNSIQIPGIIIDLNF